MRKLAYVLAGSLVALVGFSAGAVSSQLKAFPYNLVTRFERLVFGRDLSPIAGYQLRDLMQKSRPFDRIVMLGDSHAELGNWYQLLGRVDIANRGIAGETTAGLLKRIAEKQPEGSQVFVIIGTNDVDRSTPEKSMANIGSIVRQLSRKNEVFLISTPLTADRERNKFNAALIDGEAKLCREARCTFVDINQAIAPDGVLPERYSVDGIHLNDDGYRAVTTILKPIIAPPLSATN